MNIKKILILIMVFSSLGFLPPVLASSNLEQSDVDQLNSDSTTGEEEFDARDVVEEQIEDWINAKYSSKSNVTYYSAVAKVQADASNSSWVKSRQVAFEKAMINAQADFIYDTFGNILTQKEKSLTANNSDDARDFADSKLDGKSRIEAIWDKALLAGESKLDRMLAEEGIDSSELDSLPPAERKDLFVEKMITKTFKKAFGESSGMLPVKTFEGDDGKGGNYIGVVMGYSPKYRQLASDISRGIDPGIGKKKGKSINEWVEYTPEVMSRNFGLRLAVDENAKVILLSFGQWGYSYKGTSANVKDRQTEMAKNQAKTIADEQIVTFLNSKLAFEEESERGESVEHFIVKQGNEITEKEVANVIDKMMSKVKQQAQGKVAGIRTIKSWKYKHPYGHEIIGVVRAWSRDVYDEAQEVKNFKPQAKSAQQNDSNPTHNTKPSVEESPEFADPDEFF